MQLRFLPDFYIPPLGTPLYWRNETSGKLQDAICQFFNHVAGEAEPPTDEQLQLIIAYCEYFINAPCWGDVGGMLKKARDQVKALQTVEDLRAWIRLCLRAGLDPF